MIKAIWMTAAAVGLSMVAGPCGADDKVANFGPYMQELQAKIKRAWHTTKQQESTRVVTDFIVRRDGTVKDVRVTVSSGNKQMDDAAIAAVHAASPFPKLPDNSPEEVPIRFTFDRNIRDRRVQNGTVIPNMVQGEITEAEWDKQRLMQLLEAHGARAFANRDYAVAASKYAAMLHLEPANQIARKGYASAQSRRRASTALKDSDKLLTALERAALDGVVGPKRTSTTGPKEAQLNNEGVKLLSERKISEAIQCFEKALQLNPGYSLAKNNLAISYNNYALTLPPPQAVRYFHKALSLDPLNATTNKNLTVSCETPGVSAADIAEFVKQAANQPNAAKSSTVRISQGLAYELAPDWVKARQEFESAIQLDPKNEAAKKLLATQPQRQALRAHCHLLGEARGLRGDKRYDEAVARLTTAVEAQPTWPDGWTELGTTLVQKGDLPGAEKAFQKALALSPQYAEATAGLAECKRKMETSK